MKKVSFRNGKDALRGAKSVCMTAWVVLALCCGGCDKEDDNLPDDGEYTGDEIPGAIPGFGENGDDLRGTTFTLPEGITFLGDIMGYDSSEDYETLSAAPTGKLDLLSARLSADDHAVKTRATVKADAQRGSGGLVTLLLTLKNNTSKSVTVEFPAGLIFQSATGEYQNGILLKLTKVTVPAGSTGYHVVLHLYCGNASRHASDGTAHYLAPIITDSELLLYLCGLVKDRKINVEENQDILEQISYIMIVLRIQMIVWKVTDNGEMLTQDDLDYIRSLDKS
jgi:hypothetical protein